MRPFSDAFLADYLARLGERVRRTVGAYEIEGPGIQLMDRIEGDMFTVIGLPLLALLFELRARGAIAG
jgi:septum formation protein